MTILDRLFAAGYDTAFARSEAKGLRAARAQLVGRAHGVVVELGAGTGLNAEHYDRAKVTRVIATEPDPNMAKQLRTRADKPIEVVEAAAERLPVGDGEADVVVSTLVLCTVAAPWSALREVHRVLRPGGTFLFYEHVAGEEGSRLHKWQHRIETPWGWFTGGCHPNRDTRAELERSPLEITEITDTRFPAMPGLVGPVITGAAIKPA